MIDIVKIVESELTRINSTTDGGHLRTGEIRKLSGKIFRDIADKSKENVFRISESLLEQRNWAMGVIAFDFAERIKKQYDIKTFPVFESWLVKYVRGWGDLMIFVHMLLESLSARTLIWYRILFRGPDVRNSGCAEQQQLC